MGYRHWLAFTVVVLLAGCGGSPAPAVSPISSIPFDEIRSPHFIGPDALDPGPDRGGRALKSEVFADGVVRFDEYERAMDAYAQCVREEGFPVDGPSVQSPQVGALIAPGEDPGDLLIVSFPGVFDASESERLSLADIRCQEEWRYAIEFVWREQNRATGEDLQRWLDRAWECARLRGFPLSDPPTEIEAVMSAHDGFAGDGCVPWE
ncbi:MAG: hypothetical protein WEA29_07090 [Acidimicrobiia bacterium]